VTSASSVVAYELKRPKPLNWVEIALRVNVYIIFNLFKMWRFRYMLPDNMQNHLDVLYVTNKDISKKIRNYILFYIENKFIYCSQESIEFIHYLMN